MKLKIALLQMLPASEDITANTKIADEFCRKAAALGADIAVFPEMFSVGYPTPYNDNNSFAAWNQIILANEKPVDLEQNIVKYRSLAIPDDHAYLNHFRTLAKTLNMAIVVTYMSQGKVYPRNTALLIDRFGQDIIKYSKRFLFQPFFIDAICEPGDESLVRTLNTKAGSIEIGLLVCADRNLPEPSIILMKKGAELVIITNSCPLQGLDGKILDTVKIRAYENAMAFVICNYPKPKDDGFSTAFAPDGTPLLKAGNEEGVYIAEYDLKAIRQYRKHTHYGDAFRPEEFFAETLGGKVKAPFASRLNALGERPKRYDERK